MIHLRIISVSQVCDLYHFMADMASGKACDCKSLHWKFSNKSGCDGESSRVQTNNAND